MQRFRKKDREQRLPRLPLTDAQRRANRAGSFVRKYLQRGAIAPPDACERCGLGNPSVAARPVRPLLLPSDPAQKGSSLGLCALSAPAAGLRRGDHGDLAMARPDRGARRKPIPLPPLLAAALSSVQAKFPAGASSSLRDAALLATLVAALTPGQRERLYAAGAREGRTGDRPPIPISTRCCGGGSLTSGRNARAMRGQPAAWRSPRCRANPAELPGRAPAAASAILTAQRADGPASPGRTSSRARTPRGRRG